ncbi:MAG: hypothetical protein IKV73_05705 [Clostridia bacterium]|nr:hypothetical protein [Clostridia bacterium]
MLAFLFFCVRVALVVTSIALSFVAFYTGFKCMKTDHLRDKGGESRVLGEYKVIFRFCVIVGAVAKLLFWLVIPDLGNTLSLLIIGDFAALLAIDAVALVFMLIPFHRWVNKEKYVACSLHSSVRWIIYSASGVLVDCLLVYLTGFPAA